MKNFLLSIIKPKGSYAKWLVFWALVLIAILGTLGYFQIVRQYLDTELLTFGIGTYQISLYELLRALTTVVFVFWLAAIISDFAENRIGKLSGLRAANRALAMKITQISIYVIAFLIALDFVGIDLNTLTIFSGALGIGLGFGLQKIASNFISGLILLFEKSIEIGDLVELADGTYGFVKKLSGRFTLIETFESKEILIPNEDLITSRVTNWTYTNSQGRSEIKIGVSYRSDIEKARELILEAASAHPRCTSSPDEKAVRRTTVDISVS